MPSAYSEYVLKLGQMAKIRRSFFGESNSVIYAGMPGESVYSVAVVSSEGYSAMAYNLFLPLESKKIRLPKGSLIVSHVAADEIRFTVES